MSEKKYVKRIGWVVEHRATKRHKWIRLNHIYATTKHGAAWRYDNEVISRYRFENGKSRKLVRLKPVYVEVQDAKA